MPRLCELLMTLVQVAWLPAPEMNEGEELGVVGVKRSDLVEEVGGVGLDLLKDRFQTGGRRRRSRLGGRSRLSGLAAVVGRLRRLGE
jgi:hypothetical protein